MIYRIFVRFYFLVFSRFYYGFRYHKAFVPVLGLNFGVKMFVRPVPPGTEVPAHDSRKSCGLSVGAKMSLKDFFRP